MIKSATKLPESVFAALATLGLFVALGAACAAQCGGRFVYTLDDPYIHLAIARQIAAGGYGLNPGEFSAPASSVLWPFLLAPFAHTSFFEFVPLGLNALFLAVSAGVVSICWSEIWPGERWRDRVGRFGLTLLTVLVSNAVAVGLTGMEHGLQMLLTNLAALGLIRLARGERPPRFLIAALALAPLVRYENLALTGAACVWLWVAGHRRGAVFAVVAPVVVLAGFSLMLHAHGLGWLPTSVLAKAGDGRGLSRLSFAFIWFALTMVAGSILLDRRAKAVPLLTVVAVAVVAHALVGRIGWFQRYEIYLYSIGVIAVGFAIGEWWRRSKQLVNWMTTGFTLVALISFNTALLSPVASSSVYRQQMQSMRFVRDYARCPVACNDIGAMAFGSGEYVVDLWGLASLPILRARLASHDGTWMSDAATEHGAPLAVIYDDWFPHRPASWTAIGETTIDGPKAAIAGRTVTFYSTYPAETERLRVAFRQFAATLPPGTHGLGR